MPSLRLGVRGDISAVVRGGFIIRVHGSPHLFEALPLPQELMKTSACKGLIVLI